MTVPTDPLYASQWHFALIGDIEAIWDEFDGSGVSVGIYDNGLQYTHPDLDDNYDASLHFVDSNNTLYDPMQQLGSDGHGTAAAGLVGAEAGNGIGGVGVAPGVSLTGVNFINDLQFRPLWVAAEGLKWAENFDIMSGSWGITPFFQQFQNLSDPTSTAAWFETQFAHAAENGRGGLGTVIVQASGNDGRNANGDGINASRFTITVAATDETGAYEAYANFGSAVHLVAPAATHTTDLIGSAGRNGIANALDYTNDFDGTSAATPLVSGVVALMLEANPNLGWRDVQTILALSAAQTGAPYPNDGWTANGAANWNGGGISFNADYGFGMVDSFAAVRMAEAWALFSATPHTSANELEVSASYDEASLGAIALADRSGATNGETVVAIDVRDDIRIENIQVTLDLQHASGSDLRATLVAPTGETFALLANDGTRSFLDARTSWTFGVTGALGMDSAGLWSLRLEDSVSGSAGTLFDATLDFYGSAARVDTVYHFTADFPALVAAEPGRGTLADGDGGEDWLNLAAIAGDVEVDLSDLGFIEVDEIHWVDFAPGTVIENAVTGDGDDRLTGNADNNDLHGGRGDDHFTATAGADLFDGGQGTDTVDYTGALAGVAASLALGGSAGLAAGDRYRAIEVLLGSQFADILTGDDEANRIEGGDGADVISGAGGDDVILDGDGADTASGGTGDDTFFAGDGADAYDGGDHTDTVDFKHAGAGVSADLAGGGSAGIAAGDTYTAIENLLGSAFGDTLTGNGEANVIDGREGADVLRGGGGADEIRDGTGNDTVYGDAGDDLFIAGAGADAYDGGDDTDTVEFKNAEAGVEASLSGGGTGGIAAGDSFAFIENLLGSDYDDVLTGDDGANRIVGRDGNDIISGGAGPDILEGGEGHDIIDGGPGVDQISLGAGNDIVRGFLRDFFGDKITDFTATDQLIFLDQQVAREAIEVAQGSTILSVDDTGDGNADGAITLGGELTGGDFMAAFDGTDTKVSFESFLPSLAEMVAIDGAAVNGIINQDFLTSDGNTGFRLTVNSGLAGSGFNNAIGVYEIDPSGAILDVRIVLANANAPPPAGVEITGVDAGHTLGLFIVQDGANWASGLGAGDTLSFTDGIGGPPAHVDDGFDVRLAVNGSNSDEQVFHAYDASLNSDRVAHALSGVDPGGASITVGFEDMTGGGDQDYQDVVFSLSVFDIA